MRPLNCAAARWLGLCGACLPVMRAYAHGFVGDRFFPPTIATDDPFATDELSLPTFSYYEEPADGGTNSTKIYDTGFEFDKEVFPHFAIGIADDYLIQKPRDQASAKGWDNLSLSAKYQLWQNDAHEAIISVGAEADIGRTGNGQTDDSFTTFTPTFYFGKGFGDVPADAIKPFAITGTLGQTLATQAQDANEFQWGLAIEYSLPYLQQHVKDIGLPSPLKDMFPLVELVFSTPENRRGGGTTGTINPGVLWEIRDFQLGAEVLIPLNHASGDHVGFVINLQIYIDDLFPNVFGYPLFGN